MAKLALCWLATLACDNPVHAPWRAGLTRNRDTLKSFEAGALEDVTTHHLVELETREMPIPETLITARPAIGSRLQYLQHMFPGLQEAETAASARGNNGVVSVGDSVVVSVTGGSNPPRPHAPPHRNAD